MEVAATLSRAPLSAVNCCAEDTTCAWSSRPTWLASPSRLGLPRSPTDRICSPSWRRSASSVTRTDRLRKFWRIQDLIRFAREARELLAQTWRQTSTTLTPLADGADLLFTGQYLEASAANVAEYYSIPFATLHHYPLRANRSASSKPAGAGEPAQQ